MTGFAFPEIIMVLSSLAEAGDWDSVHKIYAKYLPLIVLEQQPGGLAIRKEIYHQRGLVATPLLRHPGKGISPEMKRMVDEQLDRSFPCIDISQPLSREDILAL
jgi:4-hydroxy-tetrahydrodipicolinate synthase